MDGDQDQNSLSLGFLLLFMAMIVGVFVLGMVIGWAVCP